MVNNLLAWLITAICTGFCLLSQELVKITLLSNNASETVPIVTGILHLAYKFPQEDRFGMNYFKAFEDLFVRLFYVALILSLIIFYIAFSYFSKNISKVFQIGFGLILSGLISNFCELVYFDEVAVYISFQFFSIPIFKLSDLFIFSGLVTSVSSIAWRIIRGKTSK